MNLYDWSSFGRKTWAKKAVLRIPVRFLHPPSVMDELPILLCQTVPRPSSAKVARRSRVGWAGSWTSAVVWRNPYGHAVPGQPRASRQRGQNLCFAANGAATQRTCPPYAATKQQWCCYSLKKSSTHFRARGSRGARRRAHEAFAIVMGSSFIRYAKCTPP
jgi:hypothetical protein